MHLLTMELFSSRRSCFKLMTSAAVHQSLVFDDLRKSVGVISDIYVLTKVAVVSVAEVTIATVAHTVQK